MKDKEFKGLDHPVGDCEISTLGTEIFPGYKPDATVRDRSGRLRYILESEQKTDRKAYLGSFIKAEMYAEKEGGNLGLIIVMKEVSNTSVEQIAKHLVPYKEWIESKRRGSGGLSFVQVLSDEEYKNAVDEKDTIGSSSFRRRGRLV